MGDLRFTVTQQVPISGEVSIAAIQSTRITPDNSISLVDYHESYKDNLDEYVYHMADTTPILGYYTGDGPRDYQFVVTDKVKYSSDTTRDTILLPYEYQPKYDHYDAGANPSGSISICYENGEVVEDAKYDIEFCTTPLWVSYTSLARYNRSISWSKVPGIYPPPVWADLDQGKNVYRVRLLLSEDVCYNSNTYYIKYNKVRKYSTGPGIDPPTDVFYSNMEVINPQPIYSYGLDYEWNNGSSKIDAVVGGKLTESSTYVKRSKINRLRVVLPRANSREGWYPRVWAGSFTDKYSSKNYYSYEILNHQAASVDWASGGDAKVSPRCSTISHEEATILSSRKIKLNEYPLYFTTGAYPNYCPDELYDAVYYSTATVDSVSADNTGITILKNDTKISNTEISDYDLWNGIIIFNTDIEFTDRFNVSYLYRQMYYTMQTPDMCPQVHHTKPPSNGYMGDGDSIVIAMLPTSVVAGNQSILWYYKKDNPNDLYNGSKYGYPAVIAATDPTGPAVALAASTIKLAELSIRRYPPNSMLTIYDSRLRGGGIIDDMQMKLLRIDHRERESIQEESNYYADIGLYDGQGLKKDGVLVITIPLGVLNSMRDHIHTEVPNITWDNAHIMALKEVRKIIDNNIALGTYYVIVDENNTLWPPIYGT